MFEATDVVTILGRRGTGKSFLCNRIQSCFPRIVIFDTMHEYTGGMIVRNFEEFALVIRETFMNSEFRIVIQFALQCENKDLVFEEILKVLYALQGICIVIEEIHEYASAHRIPAILKFTVLTGRHRKIAMICTSQRCADVNKGILAQSNHIYSGQLHTVSDVKYLSEVIGEVAKETLPKLEERKFLHWTPNGTTSVVNNDLTDISRKDI